MSGPAAWVTPAGQGEGEGLAAYRTLLVAAHPELADSTFRLLTSGWGCVGIDVDDRLIFKVPRDPKSAATLASEARLLDLVRPAVTVPTPDLVLFRHPRLHSRHTKLQGEHLLPHEYAALPEAARAQLAEDLAGFFAELHAIPLAAARGAGAGPEPPWPPLDQVARLAAPMLPESLSVGGHAVLTAFADWTSDPLGEVLGHFDVHGWNMAWDRRASRLNGLYDFGDARLGGPHLEFVAVALVGADLVARVSRAYERRTGRAVDLDRVAVLTAAWRLRELAAEAAETDVPDPFTLAQAKEWVAAGARALSKTR